MGKLWNILLFAILHSRKSTYSVLLHTVYCLLFIVYYHWVAGVVEVAFTYNLAFLQRGAGRRGCITYNGGLYFRSK